MTTSYPDAAIAADLAEIRMYRAQIAAIAAAHELVFPQHRRGRPPGSGTYETAEDFRRAVCPIIQALWKRGTHPSLERVAQLLPSRPTPRQLRRWVKSHLGLSWPDFLSRVI